MDTAENSVKDRTRLFAIGGILGSAGFIFLGFIVFSVVCPCAVTPGGVLFGDTIEEPVSDWNNTTANQENL